jgi:hypothetical protein
MVWKPARPLPGRLRWDKMPQACIWLGAVPWSSKCRKLLRILEQQSGLSGGDLPLTGELAGLSDGRRIDLEQLGQDRP